MNCEEFVFNPVQVTMPLIKDSLRCLVNTVVFCRCVGDMGLLECQEDRSELLGIEYCRMKEVGMKTDFNGVIEHNIKEFCRKLETSSDGSLVFVLAFFVPRQRPAARSFWDLLSTPLDDKAVFEKWKFQIDLASNRTNSFDVAEAAHAEREAIESAKNQIRERMYYIIRKINDRMDHLPCPPSDQIPFHFDISYIPSIPKAKSIPGSPQSTPQMLWSPKSIAQSIRSIPFIT
jgi:hypothetical protein